MSLDRTPGRTAGARPVDGGTKVAERAAVRIAWSISALAVVLGASFLALLVLNSRDPDVVTYEYWGAQAVTAIVFPAVGALIVSRHPRNLLGWLFCLIGLSSGLSGLALGYATHALVVRPGSLPGGATAAWLDTLFGTLGFVSLALIPLLFPDGRPASRRWRPVVWIAAGAIVVGTVSLALTPGPLEGQLAVDNPFGIEGAKGVLELLFSAGALIVVAALTAGMVSLISRYRRSRGAERQQLKWFTYAVALPPLALLVNTLLPELSWLIGGVGVACIPVAIGIAILRHRLYDIDFIINRTLVYGALTACVIGLYIFVVVYLGALFRTGGNVMVSLVATGVVAVLFAPLRDGLQRGVNRLLYGERDDPYRVLSRLGQRLEANLTPDAALSTIVETIAGALKLPYSAIEIRRDGGFETAAEYGAPSGDTVVKSLAHQGEPVGRLVLAPRGPGEELSTQDEKLLKDLSRQAGAAAHAVRLAADLQRSRARLVTAREDERRRLRRDLHDGLGPRLAAQTLKAGSARMLYARDPAAADALLSGLEADMESAIAEVRRLVYDLRPPALDELGLAGAVREAAAQYETKGLRIPIDASGKLSDLPAAVEVAAYRIVMEALTNVVRHAGARRCDVRLSWEGDALEVEVSDDGVGLPAAQPAGVGFHSMRERAEELGGTCRIGPSPAGGVRVLARLPVGKE